ncbi:MAG: pseudouridine synthase [Pirellulales bacterium]
MPGRPTRKKSPLRGGPGEPVGDSPAGQRLQKVLAASGLGSRRQCEELILTGRVEVDGQITLELGTKVMPGRQQIRVDGIALKKPRVVHYLLNKPMGVLATNNDPSGRERVIDMVPQDHDHIFPVGRLDMSSEGLIIITNDGELANLLTHPRYGVEKTYQVLVAGQVTFDEMERLKKGVFLAEGFAKVVRLTVKSQTKRGTLMEIVLDEGRNREIRRLLARVGHKVLKLKRVAIGDVKLADLATGEYRKMRPDELRSLRASALASRRRPAQTRHAPAAGKKARPAKAAPVKAASGKAPDSPATAAADTGDATARADVDKRFRMSAAAAAKRPQRRTILGSPPPADGDGQVSRPVVSGKHRTARPRPGKKPKSKFTGTGAGASTTSSMADGQDKQGVRPGKPRGGKARAETRSTGEMGGGGPAKSRKPKPLRKKGRRP